MKELPILFSTTMVQAILPGRKKQTRRTTGLETFNENPDSWTFQSMAYHEQLGLQAFFVPKETGQGWYGAKCPYGKVGDLLWVREAFGKFQDEDGDYIGYKADDLGPDFKFKPSIHMPKTAARIWLEITDIRVERLHDISEADAINEGVEIVTPEGVHPGYRDYSGHYDLLGFARQSFKSLWEEINGYESYISNPWVWVVSFDVLSTTGRPSTVTQEAAH